MRLSEFHVDHVRDFLRVHLNDAIDAMNAAVTDGLTLDHVPSANIMHGGGTILSYPSLEIAVPDFDLTNPGLGEIDWDSALQVVVRGWVQRAVAGPDAVEQVYRVSQRFAQTILAVVLPAANDAWGDHAVCTRVRGAFRVNPETGTKEELVSGFVLVLTVETVDQP